MIRAMEERDRAAVVAVAVDAGLFPAEDAGPVDRPVREHFAGGQDGHAGVVIELDGAVIGIAYWEERRGTDRGWELVMIGVAAAQQGTGLGSAMLRHVEEALGGAGQRYLLVETSGAPDFDGARRFYERHAYERVAAVPDHWAEGDDLVLYRRSFV